MKISRLAHRRNTDAALWIFWPINFSLVVCLCSLYLLPKIRHLFFVDGDFNPLITAKWILFDYKRVAVRWAVAERSLFNIPFVNSVQKPKSARISPQITLSLMTETKNTAKLNLLCALLFFFQFFAMLSVCVLTCKREDTGYQPLYSGVFA